LTEPGLVTVKKMRYYGAGSFGSILPLPFLILLRYLPSAWAEPGFGNAMKRASSGMLSFLVTVKHMVIHTGGATSLRCLRSFSFCSLECYHWCR